MKANRNRKPLIYVDAITEYPEEMISPAARKCGRKWSHLWTDPGNEDALHALAERIGMRRSWFQDKPGFPHYDLVPSRRTEALRLGAVESSLSEWVERNWNALRQARKNSREPEGYTRKGVPHRLRQVED